MSALGRHVAAELATPAPPAAQALRDAILARWGDGVSAILFYGAHRRDGGTGGLLDLYVLAERDRSLNRTFLLAAANRLLPPNVVFMAVPFDGGTVRAKVALMTRRSFAARMRADAIDTTLWTRFCQPASLLFARDESVSSWATETIGVGIRTAFAWAGQLAGPGAGVAERWRALFAATYRLELRPESGDRSAQVFKASSDWFEELGRLVDAQGDTAPVASWRARRAAGKPLNVLRLVKAAFTFEGGADYLSDKLGRHTGVAVVPTRWQRRHPLLGAPWLLLRHKHARNRRPRETNR